ncbi:unnamed protein product, partial [Prorocentrum cordatum]
RSPRRRAVRQRRPAERTRAAAPRDSGARQRQMRSARVRRARAALAPRARRRPLGGPRAAPICSKPTPGGSRGRPRRPWRRGGPRGHAEKTRPPDRGWGGIKAPAPAAAAPAAPPPHRRAAPPFGSGGRSACLAASRRRRTPSRCGSPREPAAGTAAWPSAP